MPLTSTELLVGQTVQVARGTLRIYLGAAPGVGKTYAMLDEGHRRADRGTDVVVAAVDEHGRCQIAAHAVGLSRIDTVDGAVDVAAVLRRRPAVALVDELGRSNRWREVGAILDAGIDVVTTLDISELESLNDVVTGITGVRPGCTVPDAFVRRAEQVELIDMSPDALRRRLAHGNVFPPDRVDAALANAFRPANLAALREVALRWMAERAAAELDGHPGGAERVVVALTGAPGGERLVRRAARLAGERRGSLIGVHVSSGDENGGGDDLDQQRDVLAQVGGTY